MVHAKLGYLCNNACLVCPYGDRRVTEGNLDEEAAARAVGAARGGRGVSRRESSGGMSLSGGEVLLRKDLLSLVRRARGGGPVWIQTNGRMLAYRRLGRHLREAGADGVLVLLLGPDAAAHDFHTRAPGSFAQSVAGIRNAAAEGLAVKVRTILTKSNYRHAGELVRVLAPLGVARLLLAFPSGVADRLFRTLVPRVAKLGEHVTRAVDLGRLCGLRVETEGLPLCHAVAPAPAEDALWGKGDPPPAGWAVHGPPCDSCGARARCAGLEAAYAKVYGFGELSPLPP